MAIAGGAVVLVDSCVLLDVITADPQWESWSAEQLRRCLIAGPVAINPLIYGEVAFAYERIEAVEEVLPRHLYAYWPIPREAAYLAARAHASYRARGGSRRMILPDFLIGAHALIERCPGLQLITPEAPIQGG